MGSLSQPDLAAVDRRCGAISDYDRVSFSATHMALTTEWQRGQKSANKKGGEKLPALHIILLPRPLHRQAAVIEDTSVPFQFLSIGNALTLIWRAPTRARSRSPPSRSFRCSAMSKADAEWNPVR
jgi:hypothetical protein